MMFVSFWDICLANLPEGGFTHRRITPDDARIRIDEARREKKLLCLSEDDLLAPYKNSEKENHDELCSVLGRHFGISLSLRDFFNQAGDEGVASYSVNPLNCAQVRGPDRLLVITCAYVLVAQDPAAPPAFKIDPSTVEFHLIEAHG